MKQLPIHSHGTFMNLFRYAAFAVLILGTQLHAADQTAPKPPPVVVFPDFTPDVPVPPNPLPSVPLVKPGELYVIQGDVAVEVIPEDAASVDTDTGPVKIRGVFFGGNGKRESKTFKGFVSIVEPSATASGRVKLRLWSSGNPIPTYTDHFIDIGVAPIPPPGPNPPEPKPEPKPVVTASKLWIINIDNRVKTDAATVALLGNLAYWNGLKKSGHLFSNMQASPDLDPRFTNQSVIDKFSDAVKRQGLPLTLILDGSPGKQPTELKLMRTPTSAADMDAVIKQLTGK